jgi:hypothetical protein
MVAAAEDIFPRIDRIIVSFLGLFWLADLAYFDVMLLSDVLRAIR